MHPITYKLKNIVNKLKDQNVGDDYIMKALKEELQDFILSFIFNNKQYKDLVFYGGTCLRKVYDLERLSEDLDFANPKSVILDKFAKDLTDYFHKTLDYKNVEVQTQLGDLISRRTVKFEILHDLGLSGYQSEKLHVKVEIAESSSKGSTKYKTQLTPYSNGINSFLINHYDLDIMMSGKIAAALTRIYKKGDTGILIKGRDYYDLIWYLKKQIKPNEEYLKDLLGLTLKETLLQLNEKVKQIDSKDLLTDLEGFFPNKEYIRSWCNNFHEFYKRYSGYLTTKSE